MPPVPALITELSQTAGSNYPAGSESPSTADDYLRTYAAFIATLRDGKGFAAEATVASAATVDIGAANSLYVQITGTTTITSFGSNYNGPRFVRFAGALVLTHNASSLILPGGANITTAAGDAAILVPQSAGWRVVSYNRAAPSSAVQTGTKVTASGTSIDFTSIPSWVRRITVSFSGVSTNGTSVPLVQLGDSGGIESTGYTGTVWSIAGVTGSNLSTGFTVLASTAAATVFQGLLTLVLTDASTNTWTAAGQMGLTGGSTNVHAMGGTKDLSATLDRIRITTAGGADTFDAGTINILFE